MQPGTIVTYFDKDKLASGLCLEGKGNKVRLLSERNSTLTVNLNRVVHRYEKNLNLTLPREELLRMLRAAVAEAERLKESVDTEDLWHLLHDEGERFEVSTLAEVVFGTNPSPVQLAATVRALFEDKVHYKFNNGSFVVHPPHKVQQIAMKLQRDAERERDLQEGSTWLKKVWNGIPVFDPPGRERYIALLRELAVFGPEAPDYQKGKQMLKRAGISHPDGSFKLLVTLGEMEEDENLLIHRYGIPTRWPDEALGEADEICRAATALSPSVMASRSDMTSLEVFSIDSETTRDIDDAVHIEVSEASFQVGIHIADVAHHLIPGSHLDREASFRTVSLYFPEVTVPMFPPLLSEDVFSLTAGKQRLAISVLVEFDRDFSLREFTIVPSVIRVKHRYSYNRADELVKNDEKFSRLMCIARALRDQRLRAGALFLPIPEVVVKVDGEGNIRVSTRERETPAEMIISELMILTNRLCAGFLHDRDIPLIYRSQPEPRDTLEGAGRDNLFINYRQRRLLSRMTLSTVPGNHSGLGVKPYSTFTSPIRRYLDLVAQRQLRSVLLDDRKPYSEEELRQLVVDTELNQPKLNLVQDQRRRYWLLKYLKDRVGETLPAVVVRTLFHRSELLLKDYLLETSIPSLPADSLSPGTTVFLKLQQVDPRSGLIRGAPVR